MSRPACVNGRIPDVPAQQPHHPLRDRRDIDYPAGMKLVPCASCGFDMPAARQRIYPECITCTGDARHSRPAMPEYETVVWSRGERL